MELPFLSYASPLGLLLHSRKANTNEKGSLIQNKNDGITINILYLRNKKAITFVLKLSIVDETILKNYQKRIQKNSLTTRVK